ncbi:amidase [Nocardioides speluncae]|uniref:amidase n=1 Tax=Nocardioides speluncae TaxID=2670337 RepID=UPI000D687E91|nr:amidase [Nocardioides speluncae]
MTRVHAFTDDALGDLDTVGLVEAIQGRQVSIPEVVDAAIARIEKVNPELNGLAYADYDRARMQAKDPRGGYFAGVPTLVKDNSNVAGIPTQNGSDAFTMPPSRADGDYARMYHATGMLTLGKSQLSEFGFTPTAEHARLGSVASPWNTEHPAGASSAGAAAFVAAGALPIAHANDGGGSIRIPAAVNGLVGLKPTRGRIPSDKELRQMPVQVVADGVVTRSMRDTAAFFREAERVYRNRALPPVGEVTGPGRDRLRIAVVTRSPDRASTPEVREQTLKTAALLEGLGHHVEEIAPPVPHYLTEDFITYWSFLSLFVMQTGRRAFGASYDPTKHDGITLGFAQLARRRMPMLPFAIARLRASRRLTARVFKQYDVILTPTLGTATPKLGWVGAEVDFETRLERLRDWVVFTPLHNATGDPALSLPLGQTTDGMPLGMMFAAAAGREARLLELGFELEQAQPWARIQD